MKINNEVRRLYAELEEKASRLRSEVRDKFSKSLEDNEWLYKDRVKLVESYALKLETGRVGDPSNPEDFFACTIIVHTQSQILLAEYLVASIFQVVERKPPKDDETFKDSSSFTFDDVRLYAKRVAGMTPLNQDLDDFVFEIQVKTILQYAWGVATHDLIYKTDTISWPKERIAYQVKAMLEHADIVISEAEDLSKAASISKKNKTTENIVNIIKVIEGFWPKDGLPKDKKRLAQNLQNLLKIANIDINHLKDVMESEIKRIGALPSNISPYSFAIQAISNNNSVNFQGKLNTAKGNIKIFVNSDMDVPSWLLAPHDRIIKL